MSVKIGLISDVHATPAPVEEALSLFQQEQVDFTICAGDIAGYGDQLDQTLELLIDANCQIVLGNHDTWHLEDTRQEEDGWVEKIFRNSPLCLDLQIENKRLFVVHASPPLSQMEGINLRDKDGKLVPEEMSLWETYLEPYGYDVLVVGHSHQVLAERLGETLLINPGSTVFNHSCAILQLPEMDVQIHPLSNKQALMSWNWGTWQANKNKPS